MLTIGETLRDTRIAKGISLEQAEEDTKIRKRYLQALEEGDYSILPGMVYAKGFLRNYANYLGLNQDEIMIEYKLLNTPVRDNGSRPNIEEAIHKRRANNRVNRKAYLITVIVAVIAILTFALYSMVVKKDSDIPKSGDNGNQVKTGQQAQNNNDQTGNSGQVDNQENKPESTPNQSESNPPGQGAKPEGQPTSPQVQPENPPEAVSEGEQSSGVSSGDLPGEGEVKVKLVLNSIEASWIKVYVDGRVEFTGILKPGETKTFAAEDKIKFRSGNAGGVEVTLNGQNLGTLGPTGKVVDREFTSQPSAEAEQNR